MDEVQVFNVLALTEHWLKQCTQILVDIPNYNMASCFTRSTYNHGGSFIFVKQKLNYTEL